MWTLALMIGCDPGKIEVEDTGTPVETPDPDAEDSGAAVSGEPVAVAGLDQSRGPLEQALLDASGSYDPDGLEITAVAWTLVSAPAGSQAALDAPDSPTPALWLDLAGTYTLSLTVQNSAGVWDSTPDTLKVTATPSDGLYVELWWDSDADLDLHLMGEDAELFGATDCTYCQPDPSWGAPASTDDDPALMLDDTSGYGPEVIAIAAPSEGLAHVGVHYFTDAAASSAAPVSAATVNVWVDGLLSGTYTGTLDAVGELWSVASASLPDGALTTVDSYDSSEVRTCQY